MAMDVNWTQNPEQNVTASRDACSAPAQMAMPDWVLAAALHWGLFWGGWYTCPKAGQTSVFRDTHHFEFRGSPALARQILAKNSASGASPPVVPGIADLLLSCGDRGASVAALRALLAPGDRPNESDSLQETFTPALATALTKVQTRLGLPATGAFDPATAAALGVTVHHTEVFPVLHTNSCGAAVQALQGKLGMTASGTFGSTTLTQLRSWQKAHGLAPTGITDTATAVALGLRLATSPPPTATTTADTTTTTADTTTTSDGSTTTATTTTTPPSTTVDPAAPKVMIPLKSGSSGTSVRTLQRALTKAGYRTPVTGSFGSTTTRNLRKFMTDHSLPVSSTLTVAAAHALGLRPVPKVPTSPGAKGEHVVMLQNRLRDAGFVAIVADGTFGTRTKAALKAYQESQGLKVTGILDAKTSASLGW
jgi:peptidoglycan hydrolase-like protein with peptidoglycan-binding domain